MNFFQFTCLNTNQPTDFIACANSLTPGSFVLSKYIFNIKNKLIFLIY